MNEGIPSPGDVLGKLNPFGVAGDAIGKAAAEGWAGVMMAVWKSGLWVLRFVLSAMDKWITPDLSENGPAGELYRTTFWVAGVLVLLMAFVQIGAAAFRRDGKSLGTLLVGLAQFIAVWAGGISYAIGVVAACAGISNALIKSLLNVDSFAQWNPTGTDDMTTGGIEIVVATTLGFLGVFLWIAAIGHFFVMLTRAASLLILVAWSPATAAGLVSDVSKSWFWKSLRWFHAAAATPPLTIVMIGMGTALTQGVASGEAKSAEAALGTAFPGVMIILISVVAPVALFKLLAFVDPGTSSGAAMRAGMQSVGGLGGLLSGGGQDSGSSTASQSSSNGQSQGEAQSTEATTSRFGSAMGALGGVGGAYGKVLAAVGSFGAGATAVGMDQANQMGVGDSSYTPDYQRGGQRFNPDQRDQGGDGDSQSGPSDPHGGAGSSGTSNPPTAPMPTMPSMPGSGPSAGGPPSPGGAGGAGGGKAAGGGGAGAAAAEIPPVA
jgi:type IV secretion system protein TrbL